MESKYKRIEKEIGGFKMKKRFDLDGNKYFMVYITTEDETKRIIKVLKWVYNLEQNVNQSSEKDTFCFGFDAEFERREHRPCTLQFSTYFLSVLIHISTIQYVPVSLIEFIEDSHTLFLGVGIFFDASKLWQHMRIKITNIIDLTNTLLHFDVIQKRLTLKRIGEGLCNLRSITKLQSIIHNLKNSFWDSMFLEWERIEYACSDSFVGYFAGMLVFSYLNIFQYSPYDFYMERAHKKYKKTPTSSNFSLLHSQLLSSDILGKKSPFLASESEENEMIRKMKKIQRSRWKSIKNSPPTMIYSEEDVKKKQEIYQFESELCLRIEDVSKNQRTRETIEASIQFLMKDDETDVDETKYKNVLNNFKFG